MKKPIARLLLLHLAIAASLTAAMLLCYIFLDSCPIRALTGLPCPTCAMSRAMFALLRLDFGSYLYYHPLALPFGIVLWFAFHWELFRISKKAKDAVLIAAAVTVLAVYAVRLCLHAIP